VKPQRPVRRRFAGGKGKEPSANETTNTMSCFLLERRRKFTPSSLGAKPVADLLCSRPRPS